MNVLNVHKRIINQPKEVITPLLATLATKEDKIWPIDNWPRMKLKDGLKVGSRGGHGPIGYVVQQYIPGELIEFKFISPNGFHGIHKFEMNALTDKQTEIKHVIDMETSGIGSLTWSIGIRWLHDALIEDAFDNIENHFEEEKKATKWNLWVRLLRKALN